MYNQTNLQKLQDNEKTIEKGQEELDGKKNVENAQKGLKICQKMIQKELAKTLAFSKEGMWH